FRPIGNTSRYVAVDLRVRRLDAAAAAPRHDTYGMRGSDRDVATAAACGSRRENAGHPDGSRQDGFHGVILSFRRVAGRAVLSFAAIVPNVACATRSPVLSSSATKS